MENTKRSIRGDKRRQSLVAIANILKGTFRTLTGREFLFFSLRKLGRIHLNNYVQIYQFLEIDETYKPQNIGSRPSAAVYSIPRLRLLRLRNRHRYTYNAERTRLYIKSQSRWDKSLCRLIEAIDRLLLERVLGNEKPRMSGDLLQNLRALYEQDIVCLERLLSRDLTIWRQA